MESVNTVSDKIKSNIYSVRTPTSKKRSDVWKSLNEIFDDKENKLVNFVACSYCSTALRYDSKKLGNNHLKSHIDNHRATTSISRFLKREKEFSSADKRTVLESFIDFVTLDLRPFNSVNGTGMVKLLHTFMKLGSMYGCLEQEAIQRVLPCVSTISRNIESMANQKMSALRDELKSVLLNGQTIAITVDLWQDKYKRISYLGMTSHYYIERNNATALHDKIVCMKPLEPGVTKNANFIRQQIQSKLENLHINDFIDQIAFVTDRGSNIRKALNEMQRINCFPHFLNNIVKVACQIDVVKCIIDRCKSLVRYFKITGLNNLLPTALVSGCDTRFNYIHFTFKSILKNWDKIDEILRGLNEIGRLECIAYLELKALNEYLAEFDEWTRLASASKKASLYTVWIGIHAILQHTRISESDHAIVTLMKVKAFNYIQKKFVLTKLHRFATILHPVYKTLKFASFEQIRQTHMELRRELDTMELDCIENRRSSVSSSESSSSLLAFADATYNSDELVDYLQYKCPVDTNLDLIDWWNSRRNDFPKLSKFALNIHSIPASSIPSERLFSTGGNLITEKRTRLNPDSIENILILHDRL